MAYDKQTWVTGDVVTAEKLNHMEDGIANAGSGGGGGGSSYYDRPATGVHCFSVKVNTHIRNLNAIDQAATDDAYTEGTDYGYIQLPDTYSATGDPIRLIICCHGAGASLSSYQSDAPKTTDSQYYWVQLGYARMDMFANPPELSGSNTEMHYGNPVVVSCYRKGLDYVMKHFNLKRDGIFVLGSSMGGLSSTQIIQSGQFPALAHIANCPVLDLYKQPFCNSWTTQSTTRADIARYFKFTGTAPSWTTSKPPSAAEIQYFKDNFDKTIGYNPIFHSVIGGDCKATMNVYPTSPTDMSSADYLAEKELYDTLVAKYPVPLALFHCNNDTTVSPRYSQYFVNMLRRGNSLVYYHTFTTGGHSAWAAGNNVTFNNYKGQSMTIPASKYEAYQFVRRFDDDIPLNGWSG